MVAFVPVLEGRCCLWKGQRDQWAVCSWHTLFWGVFNLLAAEMEQKAVSRCLQILIFILPKQEQITHTGRRFKSEFRILWRRGGENELPASFASTPAAPAVHSFWNCWEAIHTWEVTENNVNSSNPFRIVFWDSNQMERNPPSLGRGLCANSSPGAAIAKRAKKSLLVSSTFFSLSTKSPQQEELKQVCKFFA